MYGFRFWEGLISWGPIQAARDWWTLDSINWWEREPLEGAACAPAEPMSIPELCAACQQQSSNGSLQQCSRCKRVYYCSVECQRQHWKQHKGNCSGAAANGALLSFLRAAYIFASGSASANAFHGLRQQQHWKQHRQDCRGAAANGALIACLGAAYICIRVWFCVSKCMSRLEAK